MYGREKLIGTPSAIYWQVKDELKTISSYRAVLDDMDREIIIEYPA